jgi:hypothetical protein
MLPDLQTSLTHNLDILSRYLPDAAIDLVSPDLPFISKPQR